MASMPLAPPLAPPPERQSMDQAFMDDISGQLAALQASVTRLSARAQADADVAGNARTLNLFAQRPVEKAMRKELAELPQGPATIFCEFDECMQGDVEAVLFGDVIHGRDERLAAFQALQMTLDEALAKIEAASVQLRPGFIAFAEQCSIRRLRLCVLARGLKPLIRAILREQGIGHIEVLAHDMYVDSETRKWHVSFCDASPTGHDKAESMRRALRGHQKTAVVLVGSTACDFGPVLASSVDCVIAPRTSALAGLCDDAGVRTRRFDGWNDLCASSLLRDT